MPASFRDPGYGGQDWIVGSQNTLSTSYAQNPKGKGKVRGLRASEEQALGKPPPGSLP